MQAAQRKSRPKEALLASAFKGVGMARNGELYSALQSVGQTIASHRLDHRPVLSEEHGRIVKSFGLHFDAASLPSPVIRYLKIEGVARGPSVFMDSLSFAAHSVSPLYCVDPGHFTFPNWPFVRRDYGVDRLCMSAPALRKPLWVKL